MPAITKTHLLALGIVTVVIAAALTVSLSVLGRQSAPRPTPSPTPAPQSSPTAAASPSPAENSGTTGAALATVQGKKIFPSEAIASDFRVCAVNVSTQKETCSGASGAPTYRLQVPAGSYQIYALVPSFDPNYRAYYSRFVTCGLKAECSDHTPITVTVTGGQTTGGIDVGDFYAR